MRENITRQTKFRFSYVLTLSKDDTIKIHRFWGAKGGPVLINVGSDFGDVYDNQLGVIHNRLDEFTENGSG